MNTIINHGLKFITKSCNLKDLSISWVISRSKKKKKKSTITSCSIQLIIIRLNIFPSSLVKSKSLHWTPRGQKKRTQGSPPWPIRMQANHGRSHDNAERSPVKKRTFFPPLSSVGLRKSLEKKMAPGTTAFFYIRSNFVKLLRWKRKSIYQKSRVSIVPSEPMLNQH